MKSKVIVFLLFTLMSLSAAALPRAFQASYTVEKGRLTIGEMNISLVYNGSAYSYKKSSKAKGLAKLLSGDRITQNAAGSFKGNFMQSSHYLYHHKSKRKNKKDDFTFVNPRLVKGTYKEAYEIAVPAGTIDRATMELLLARDLMANKKELSYSVVEKGKHKVYKLRRLGSETIKVAGRDYVCEKIIVERNNSNRKTISWLAKDLDYMPAQIQHIEKGSSIMTRLISLSFKE
jgi:hypothetical protein